MPEQDDKPAPSRSERKLTVFYVALGVVVVLGLFGVWFWRAYTVWWFDADEAKRRQAAAAQQFSLPVEKSVDLGDGVPLDLVLIPAGRFKMGSPIKEGRPEDEVPHWVVLTRPFYLGKYELTQEQWQKVMGPNPSNFKGAKNPVECVSWASCQEFLRKLNDLKKDRGQFRLPTGAEWEWACRAGARTRFCSGDTDQALADYAWFKANSGLTTHPVGTRKPNAWGLFDMHGNVWELCGDRYGGDLAARNTLYDPMGPDTGSHRELRSGSWNLGPKVCRSAYHCGAEPTYGDAEIGFRLVMTPAWP